VQTPAAVERIKAWYDEQTDSGVDSPPESLAVTASGIVAGVLTRKLLKAAWSRYRGTDPPVNPAAQGVTWSDALIWAAAVGAAAGVARVVGHRSSTAVARRFSKS